MDSLKCDFLEVTELAGDDVSQEQVDRICHRYYWAGSYCAGKDVLEAACGTGQGLGYLAGCARSVKAGDYSEKIAQIAQSTYADRLDICCFDAQEMPFEDSSLDVVILFEAIYYLPSAEKFVEECRRVLRPGGQVLVATANKDLYDFNPSPHSYNYYGTIELAELFGSRGFSVECFAAWPLEKVSVRQRILRPVKKLAVTLNLVPKSMAGKKLLKRLVFGGLVPMPSEVCEGMSCYEPPVSVPSDMPDRTHKVLYCAATLRD